MMREHPIYAILREARALGASDVHISPAQRVAVRLDGGIERPWDERLLTAQEFTSFWDEPGLAGARDRLADVGAADASLPMHAGVEARGAIGPVRIHATMTADGVHLAMRLLALTVPEFASLGLPMTIVDLARRQSGLVLFVGPTGSGKSTAMASVVQTIVREQKKHVVVIGEPIEYRFAPGAGMVSHIDVGAPGQAHSHASAVRSALRQDPDVLLIGESRDAATMGAALEAAEHGRLCLTSLHARDAATVFDRMIGAFPPHAQPQVRVSLANALAAVVVLRLLPRSDRPGRVAACEVLLATDAIRSMIRDDAGSGLRNAITTNATAGMQTLEADISRLVYDLGIVDPQVGKAAAVRPDEVRARGRETTPRAVGSVPARSMFSEA
jgi:twitching motility protein PilT